DVIYAVSNGQVKPSKHMSLGITLKSLTNSRKIISIVNKYGHCCSYNVLEGLETELTYAATETAQVCPPGVSLVPHLSTGVAYDNFDRFVETPNGKDTLHDTVGIIFQFDESTLKESEAPTPFRSESEDETENSDPNIQRKRRTFDAIIPDVEPYLRKPRMVHTRLPVDSQERNMNPKRLTLSYKLDLLWMISYALKIPDLPMWVGFNSQIRVFNLPPCQVELYQQYLRSRYITSVWRNAHCKLPSTLKPEENGWSEKEGKYEFAWFSGDQLPEFVEDVVIQPDKSCEDENVSDDELDDSGSEANDDWDSESEDF
ncbi:uncharacterized protein LOC114841645, partial [Diachasma alloeum]|uniref:uncharacterized protein LOC114841645 n=1 Tax=Diachasma alloeum TaxID=454923 RepID=UPI0010FB303C